MGKERTNKRRRSARARQKRKLMMTGGLALVVVLLIVLAVFVFGSCGSYDVDRSTVFIKKDGKVVSASVEAFDENIYSKDELKDYIKETIRTYNDENGKDRAKQKSFSVKKGIATLVMEYKNVGIFQDFEGIEIFTGSIPEAMDEGFAFDEVFASVAGGAVKEASFDDFRDNSEYQVVIIKANTQVNVEGTICYVSAQNVEAVGEDWVLIRNNGKSLLESGQAADTEDTQNTEAEGADGAINEDELVMETEQEIIFDFGEEETQENRYSDVYTYIIYKVK